MKTEKGWRQIANPFVFWWCRGGNPDRDFSSKGYCGNCSTGFYIPRYSDETKRKEMQSWHSQFYRDGKDAKFKDVDKYKGKTLLEEHAKIQK